MKFVSSFQDGNTTYVVAVDEDGFIHFESRWSDADGTLQGDEIVFSDSATFDLMRALKGALSIV